MLIRAIAGSQWGAVPRLVLREKSGDPLFWAARPGLWVRVEPRYCASRYHL